MNRKNKIETLIFTITIIFFFISSIISISSGGNAINGEVINGIYFLGSHGTLTEVTKLQWLFSLSLDMIVFILFIATFLVSILTPLWKSIKDRKEMKRFERNNFDKRYKE